MASEARRPDSASSGASGSPGRISMTFAPTTPCEAIWCGRRSGLGCAAAPFDPEPERDQAARRGRGFDPLDDARVDPLDAERRICSC